MSTDENKISVRYVRVRLSDVTRTVQWREVDADSLEAAIKVAEQMEDVEVCLEARLGQPDGGFYAQIDRPQQIKQFTGDGWFGSQGVVT